MTAELCPMCKRSHPGRSCDYDEKGDGIETADLSEAAKEVNRKEKEKSDFD